MKYASRVSAIQRELNSHDAAKPRTAKRSLKQPPTVIVERGATWKATVSSFVRSIRQIRAWVEPRGMRHQRHGATVAHGYPKLRRS